MTNTSMVDNYMWDKDKADLWKIVEELSELIATLEKDQTK